MRRFGDIIEDIKGHKVNALLSALRASGALQS